MNLLRRIVRKFEDEMAAAAVAQSGERELAERIMRESRMDEYQDHPSLHNQEMMHLSAEPAEGK